MSSVSTSDSFIVVIPASGVSGSCSMLMMFACFLSPVPFFVPNFATLINMKGVGLIP